MALSVRCEQLLQNGVVQDYADLAATAWRGAPSFSPRERAFRGFSQLGEINGIN
jgi:hypothetical protein